MLTKTSYSKEVSESDLSVLEEWAKALMAADGTFEHIASEEDKARARLEPEFRKRMLRSLAEISLIDRGIAPPHFKNIVNCKKCGPMPIAEKIDGEVIACPWCHAAYKNQARAA